MEKKFPISGVMRSDVTVDAETDSVDRKNPGFYHRNVRNPKPWKGMTNDL
jgi:hypothetical protein